MSTGKVPYVRLVSVAITLLLAVSLLLACKSTPAAPAKVYQLKITSGWADTGSMTNLLREYYIKPLEQNSKGAIKVTVYGEGVLASAAEAYNAMSKGVVDIVFNSTAFVSGTVPDADILALPLMPPADIVLKAFHKQGGIKDELNKVFAEKLNGKLLATGPGDALEIFTRTKEVKTLADLKGLKIASAGGAFSKTLVALGAAAAVTASPERLASVQQGINDGLVGGVSTVIVPQQGWDIVKYGVRANLFLPLSATIAINLNTWNSLPPDLQKIISDTFEAGDSKVNKEWLPNELDKSWATLESHGIKVNKLSADELARWQQAAQPLWDSYKKTAPNGAKLVDILQSTK